MSPVSTPLHPTTLLNLLGRTPVRLMVGDPRVKVTGVAYDSRTVEPGQVFVALRGSGTDGHRFVPQAVERGASCLVVSERPADVPAHVPVAVVDDTRATLALLAGSWYRRPSRAIDVLGVTGTNGKTTVTYLLEAILTAAGGRPAVIGTTGLRWNGAVTPLANTTPESLDLQAALRGLVEDGATAAALEVSSHALETHRVDGTVFATRTFTNLSRDHLDFHGDMDSYYAAKRRLFFDHPGGPAAINADDQYGRRLLGDFSTAVSYSLRPDSEAAVRPAGPPELTAQGIRVAFATPVGRVAVTSELLGRPNLENLAAAVATGVALDLPASTLERGASAALAVPGRLQRIPDERGGRLVIVDYAHTPAALERTLQTVSEIATGRIVAVFGCGGDRDGGKRPLMGAAAAQGADLCLVTDDNPRTEDPAAIRRAVVAGAPPELRDRVIEVADRRLAIERALRAARAGDAVVVAGKGHETWQERDGVRRPFDDGAVCAELLDALR